MNQPAPLQFDFVWRERGITPFWASIIPPNKRIYFFVIENGACEAFIEKKSLEKVAEDGLQLFSSAESTMKLVDDYKKIELQTLEFVRSNATVSQLSTVKLFEILPKIKAHFQLSVGAYFLTEPETTMLVDGSAAAQDWIRVVSKQRLELRKAWSALVGWTEAVFMAELGKRLGIEAPLIGYYLFFELNGGKRLKYEELVTRRNLFVCMFKQELEPLQMTLNEVNAFRKAVFGSAFELRGSIANKGHVVGKVVVCSFEALSQGIQKIQNLNEKRILVTEMTRPELSSYFSKFSGIITDEGGLLCHAAIVSREFNLPCLVGTKSATRFLNDGDIIDLNANLGIARKIF